jgi:hypothetical protein
VQTYDEKQQALSKNHISMRSHQTVTKFEERTYVKLYKANSVLQRQKSRIASKLLQRVDLPNSPQLRQVFCGSKPDHQHLQWKMLHDKQQLCTIWVKNSEQKED